MAVPAASVTVTVPLVGVAGATAVNNVLVGVPLIVAVTPFTLTAVTVNKFVPVMVKLPPVATYATEMLLIVGVAVKLVAELPVPPAVVTEIGPVTAPTGTIAVKAEAEVTVKLVAVTPPKATAVAAPMFVPVTLMLAPAAPEAVKVEITGAVGAPVTVKLADELPAPAGVVTVISPVVAPAGTPTKMEVEEMTFTLATGVPLKVTDVAPVNPDPRMLIAVPAAAEVGVNDEITGLTETVKVTELDVTVPAAFVTAMKPVNELVVVGATAVMVVLLTTTTELRAVVPTLTAVAVKKFVPRMVTDVPEAVK